MPIQRGTVGAPKKARVLEGRKVYLYADEWEWLDKWLPSDLDAKERNVSKLMASLFYRAMLFWADGPDAPPKRVKPRKPSLPHASIARYAQEHGITKEEAITLAWKEFQAKQ